MLQQADRLVRTLLQETDDWPASQPKAQKTSANPNPVATSTPSTQPASQPAQAGIKPNLTQPAQIQPRPNLNPTQNKTK